MVNRYDNPAQAEFINTYVPIPFEQLYTLGKQAKENVDQALKDYSTALDKWAEFQSPSAADTKAYYDETYGRALPVAEELSKNLDMIKTAEGRSKIYSAINNVDRAKLSMLRQSAEGLRERQKVNQRLMLEGKYNPLWHDVDFTGYNTLTSGIYNDVSPLGYQSIKDLTDKYVNNLKDSYLGRSNGFIHTGVTGDQIKKILDENKSGILSTPEAQMHMQVYLKQNPGATAEDAANAFMERAYIDNQEYIRNNITVDPYAMQALKGQQALRVAAIRKRKNGEQPTDYPDAYTKLYNDAVVQEKRQMQNNPNLTRTRSFIEGQASMIQTLTDAANALELGAITPEEYNTMYKAYQESASKNYSNEAMANAYAEDVRDMFAKQSDIFPAVGVKQEKLPLYYDTASRVLNELTYPTSGLVMNRYNKIKSSKEVEINSNDAITNGFTIPDTNGLILSTDFVNKVMKVPSMKYTVQDNSRLNRNFAEDLKSGVFQDVIKVPRNKIMVGESNGQPQLFQRVSVKIPIQSIRNANYDVDSFKEMVNKTMGLTSEVGLSVKPIKGESVEDAWGHSDTRGGAALTGEYFTFDAMEPIDPHGMTRMTFDQEVNKEHGGSKLQNDLYDSSYNESYSSDIELYQTMLNLLQ